MSPRWIPSRNRSAALLAAALAALWLPAPVQAAKPAKPAQPAKVDKATEAKVRQLYGAAQKAYDLGRFEEALKGFSEAYSLKDLPGFLFNIAQCHRNLGHHERAKFFYHRYLDLSPRPPKNAAQVKALLVKVEEKLAEDEARLRREAEQKAATQRLKDLEKQKQAELDAMEAQRRAEREKAAAVAAANAAAAATLARPLPPAAMPSPAAAQPPPTPAVAAGGAASGSVLTQWWFWTGVGVAAAGAGAATYILTAPRPRPTTLGDLGSP